MFKHFSRPTLAGCYLPLVFMLLFNGHSSAQQRQPREVALGTDLEANDNDRGPEIDPRRLSFLTHYKNELEGLNGASGIALSHDGNHVYANASTDNTLLVFQRNGENGSLRLAKTYQRRGTATIATAETVEHLLTPRCIVVSPDDRHVYVAGYELVIFVRDADSGELTFVDRIRNEWGPGNARLSQIEYMTFSPDGRNLNAVGVANDTLGVLSRDPHNGTLSIVQILQDSEQERRLADAHHIDALNFPRAVAVSPDGLHAYAVSWGDSAITAFEREENTGQLTPIDTIRDAIVGGRRVGRNHGLAHVHGVTISPDGRNVYTTSVSGYLTVFRRDAMTGRLSFLEQFRDDMEGVDGLDYALTSVVSPDGNNLYTAGADDRAIAVFQRESTEGRLKFIRAVRDEVDGIDGIAAVVSMQVTHDGKHLYSIAREQAIAVFSRIGSPEDGVAQSADRTTLADLQANDPTPPYVWRKLASRQFEADSYPVGFSWLPDGRMALVTEGSIQILDFTADAVDVNMEPAGKITRVAFSPDRTRMATGHVAGESVFDFFIQVWDLPKADAQKRMSVRGGVVDVALAGDTVAVGDSHQTTFVWDATTGELLKSLNEDLYTGSSVTLNALALSGDGQRLANVSAGTLRLFDLKTGAVRPVTKTRARILAFSPDGKILAFSEDRLRLVDWGTGEIRVSVDESYVGDICFSPNGAILAMASPDAESITLLSAATGKRLIDVPAERGVQELEFSRDGHQLAAMAYDRKRQQVRIDTWAVSPRD